jgi:hypothetical protein
MTLHCLFVFTRDLIPGDQKLGDIMVVPICLCLRKYPMFLVTKSQVIRMVFRPFLSLDPCSSCMHYDLYLVPGEQKLGDTRYIVLSSPLGPCIPRLVLRITSAISSW